MIHKFRRKLWQRVFFLQEGLSEKLKETVSESIKNKFDINIDDYSYIIASDEIRKIFKDHGSQTEILRGQQPVTSEVLQKYIDVLRAPDRIILSEKKTNDGKPVFLFEKEIDGKMTAVQTVNDKRRGLIAKTFYVGKNKKETYSTAIGFNQKIGSNPTPEAVSGSGPFDNSIAQKAGEVNSGYTTFYKSALNDAQQAAFNRFNKHGQYSAPTVKAATAQQRRAQATAGVFGHEVIFFNDESGSVNGAVDGRNVFISQNADDPVMKVLGHELTHSVMSNGKAKAEFIQLLKQETTARNDFRQRFAEKQQLYQERIGDVADDTYIWEEFAADIGGELFMDDSFIERVTQEKPTLAQRIVRWFRDIIARMRGKRFTADGENLRYVRDIDKVIRKYEKAFEKGVQAGTDGARYEIKQDRNGESYVRIDNNVLDGVPKNQWGKAISKWLNQNIQGKAFTAQSDGDVIKATRKLTNEYPNSNDSKSIYGTNEYDAKMNLVGNINEAIEISNKIASSDDKTNADGTLKHGNLAQEGWDYRIFSFEYNQKKYTGKLNVAKNANGHIAYDVTNIKEAESPSYRQPTDSGVSYISNSASTNSISDSNEEVNPNIKNSLKTKQSRFRTNTLERSTMFAEEDLAGLEPSAFEYIPESATEWESAALENVSADMDGVMKKIRDADSISGGVMAHEAALISQKLLDNYRKTGSVSDYAKMKEWTQTVAEKTRETARALKATDTAWDKNPAAAIAKAQGVVDKVNNAIDESNPKAAKERKAKERAIQKDLSQIEQEGIEQLTKEFSKVGDTIREYYENRENMRTPLADYLAQNGVPEGTAQSEAQKIVRRYRELIGNAKEQYAKTLMPNRTRFQGGIKKLSDFITSEFFAKSDYRKRVIERVHPVIAEYLQEKNINIGEVVLEGKKNTPYGQKHYLDKLLADSDGRITEFDKVQFNSIAEEEMVRLGEIKRDRELRAMFGLEKNMQSEPKSTELERLMELLHTGGDEGLTAVTDILKRKQGIPTLTKSDIDYITEHIEKAHRFEEGSREYAVEIGYVKARMESKLKAPASSKIKSLARIAMLGNPKTIISRNAMSNAIMAPIYNAENVIAAPLDIQALDIQNEALYLQMNKTSAFTYYDVNDILNKI